jgi:CRP/FNR family cyclic AMP-dependent transcriptional regulator
MDPQVIEAIGYCGTLATIATYSMRSIVPLRVAGIASSLFFIAYAAIMGVWPMLLTEFVILPINCLRLFQVLRAGEAKPRPAA